MKPASATIASHRPHRRCAGLVALALAVTTLAGWSARAKDPFIRHFRAGVLIGANINAEFHQSGTFDTASPAEGQYDDGFVGVDNTGNAGGYTSNWGYNNASQYDAAAETLTFSSSTSFNTTDSSTANSDPQFGLDLAYGGTIKRIGKTWLSWELGFSLVPINVHGDSSSEATFLENTTMYGTAGLLVPQAPYQGSPSGGPPLDTSTKSTVQSSVDGTLAASREIKAMLYNLRLGPHFHWDLTRHWAVEAMGGFAVGLADGNYNYDEQPANSTGASAASGNIQQTSWLYGGYAGVLTQVHVERNAYFYGSAQFMSLSNVEFSNAGRQAELQLDQGLYFSLGFTWLF